LLTLPLGRQTILFIKWFCSIYRFQLMLGGLFIFWNLATLCGGLHPLSLLLLLLMLVVQLSFAASLGLWLSTICPTRTRANLLAVVLLLGMVLLPLWLLHADSFLESTVNPANAWVELPFGWTGL